MARGRTRLTTVTSISCRSFLRQLCCIFFLLLLCGAGAVVDDVGIFVADVAVCCWCFFLSSVMLFSFLVLLCVGVADTLFFVFSLLMLLSMVLVLFFFLAFSRIHRCFCHFFSFFAFLFPNSWTSRGHRCRPFFPPVLAFNFYRA